MKTGSGKTTPFFCQQRASEQEVGQVWSMHVFNWRADGLDFKVDMSYEVAVQYVKYH